MSEMYDIDRQTSARNDIEAFVYIFVIGTICNTRGWLWCIDCKVSSRYSLVRTSITLSNTSRPYTSWIIQLLVIWHEHYWIGRNFVSITYQHWHQLPPNERIHYKAVSSKEPLCFTKRVIRKVMLSQGTKMICIVVPPGVYRIRLQSLLFYVIEKER